VLSCFRIGCDDGAFRRSLCLTLLAVLTVGLVGLPIQFAPTHAPNGSAASADRSGERFPCEASACGCHSAERCWDRCCCHSDAEKLRWAADNSVTPPAFLVRRVAESPAPRNCCTHEPAPVSESTWTPAGDSATGPERGGDRNRSNKTTTSRLDSPAAHDLPPDIASMRTIRLDQVAKCQGIELIWTLLSTVTVEKNGPPPLAVDPPRLGSERVIDETAESIAQLIDPPVPWVGFA